MQRRVAFVRYRTSTISSTTTPTKRSLFFNDRAIVASYPAWQAWSREHKPLVAEIHLLDAGPFALDDKNDEIASPILAFLAKHSGLTDW